MAAANPNPNPNPPPMNPNMSNRGVVGSVREMQYPAVLQVQCTLFAAKTHHVQ